MRRLFLACLALAALSGCLGSGEAEPLEAGPATPEPPPAPPEPVRVEERVDLRDGLNETTWDLRIEPGHTERRILARLEGAEGTGQVVMQGFCYHLDGRLDDGERVRRNGGNYCSGVGPAFSIGGTRTLLDVGGEDLPAGNYRFIFSAQPAVAVFTLEMVAA